MSTIEICAFHQMDHAAAQQAADDLASSLASKFDIDYGWEEDVIHFERPGVSGSITVGDKEIHIRAHLGILLMMLKSRIEVEVRQYLQSHFGCTFAD